MQEHDEDKMKLNFVLNALASDPFEQVSEPRADIQEEVASSSNTRTGGTRKRSTDFNT